MTRAAAGFTLLEVVVALAVVSLALGGALGIASASARSTHHLERTITAHWVARNVAANLELAEPETREALATFEETMLGYRFEAAAHLEKTTDGVTAVSITVSNDAEQLAAYNTWIYEN